MAAKPKKAKKKDFDIAQLLEPISAKDPSGENLRYTDVYDRIREARREEDENLPQGIWQTEVKRADWDGVVDLCVDVLMNKSKDLQVAGWLTEAWLHMEGMAGLVRGLELINGLSQEFWSSVYPMIEDDNYELRISPYEWMNSKLSEEIQKALITMPSDPTALPYCYNDWQDASRRDRLKKAQAAAGTEVTEEEENVTLAQVIAGMEQTPTAFYRHIHETSMEAVKCLTTIESELRSQLGGETPSFSKIREKIDLIGHFASAVLEERGEAQKQAEQEEKAKKMKINPGRITKLETREQAYAQLEAIAAFLKKVEPHSPTPYLIQRAISWGTMSLNEVIVDLMGNEEHDVQTLLYLLDIKKSADE